MAEKLSELESSRREFVANVSHELRSPITSIRGFVEGMRDVSLKEIARQRIDEFTTTLRKYIL